MKKPSFSRFHTALAQLVKNNGPLKRGKWLSLLVDFDQAPTPPSLISAFEVSVSPKLASLPFGEQGLAVNPRTQEHTGVELLSVLSLGEDSSHQ